MFTISHLLYITCLKTKIWSEPNDASTSQTLNFGFLVSSYFPEVKLYALKIVTCFAGEGMSGNTNFEMRIFTFLKFKKDEHA